jgi:hypothetical protein
MKMKMGSKDLRISLKKKNQRKKVALDGQTLNVIDYISTQLYVSESYPFTNFPSLTPGVKAVLGQREDGKLIRRPWSSDIFSP